MVQTTLDTAVLKAALLQLVQEDPAFFQHLLAVLPNGEGGQVKKNEGVNPLLHQIVAEDFAEYEPVFKKLA
jgi:hypothetical protein